MCSRRFAPFWQARYHDFNVFTERKFVEKLRYLHRNPVKRGQVAKAEDWPWSSFRNYAFGELGTVEIESAWTVQRRERAATSTQVSGARPGAPAENAREVARVPKGPLPPQDFLA